MNERKGIREDEWLVHLAGMQALERERFGETARKEYEPEHVKRIAEEA